MRAQRICIDQNILVCPEYKEMNIESRDRFICLLAECDQLGISNMYRVCYAEKLRAEVMRPIFESKLIWYLNEYSCFIPSVFYANINLLKRAKAILNFDLKNFQVCVNLYPEILNALGDTEKNNLLNAGIRMNVQIIPKIAGAASERLLETSDGDDTEGRDIQLHGEWISRKAYAQYQGIKITAERLDKQYGIQLFTEEYLEEWFLDKYKQNFKWNNQPIKNLIAFFEKYYNDTYINRKIEGKL